MIGLKLVRSFDILREIFYSKFSMRYPGTTKSPLRDVRWGEVVKSRQNF